jgi:ribosomal protein L40E
MICSKCGQLNYDDAQFCSKCSWNLQIQIEREKIKCPKCGELNDISFAYCRKCGKKILRHGHVAIFWLLGFVIWILGASVITMILNFSDKPLEKIITFLPIFLIIFLTLLIPGILLQFYTFRLKKYHLEHAVKKISLFRVFIVLLAVLITLNMVISLFGLYSSFCSSKNPAECNQTFGCLLVTTYNECVTGICPQFVQGSSCSPAILAIHPGSVMLQIIFVLIILLNLIIIPASLLIYYITGYQENKPANISNTGNIIGIVCSVFLILLIIFLVIWALFLRG